MLGPALADRDEIATDVRPAEDQHHVPQLHLGHGLVGRVAVDHQHHAGLGREVALGHVVAAGRVEAKDHRVLAQEDPEPPAISRLAVLGHEDHPAGLVGLGEGGRGVAQKQCVVERLKERFEAFQAAGHGARRHVQAEQPPLSQQPLRGPVTEELVEQDLHPHRHPQQPLGDQLGRRGGGDGSRTVRAGACPLVTSPSDQPAIGSDLDLDLFGILGVAGHKRRAALRANTLLLGQLAEILDDGQVTVVPPRRTGPILPLTPLGRRGRSLIVFAFEMIRTVLGRRGFALSTEELILELAVLAAKLLDLGFELLGPMHGPSMLSLPVPDLLPQFGVLAPQFGDFLAQFDHFATKLPHQFGQISRLGSRKWVDKRAFHDSNACTQNRSCRSIGQLTRENGLGEASPPGYDKSRRWC